MSAGHLYAFELYARDVRRHAVWTVEEELAAGARLLAARAAGDPRITRRIVDEFVCHNLRLVLSVVQRFRSAPVPLADLIQEGNLGLLRAVEKFDPSRGFRFATYATWWIRQAVGRALDNDGTLRTPVNVAETRRKVYRSRARFLAATGRAPTTDELVEMTGKRPRHIHRADAVAGPSLSLDMPIGEDGGPRVEMLPSHEASPLDALLTAEREREARMALETLPPRTREIMRARFGDDESTLTEIGGMWGLSRERVRQIALEAVEHLRRGGGAEDAPHDSGAGG